MTLEQATKKIVLLERANELLKVTCEDKEQIIQKLRDTLKIRTEGEQALNNRITLLERDNQWCRHVLEVIHLASEKSR